MLTCSGAGRDFTRDGGRESNPGFTVDRFLHEGARSHCQQRVSGVHAAPIGEKVPVEVYGWDFVKRLAYPRTVFPQICSVGRVEVPHKGARCGEPQIAA